MGLRLLWKPGDSGSDTIDGLSSNRVNQPRDKEVNQAKDLLQPCLAPFKSGLPSSWHSYLGGSSNIKYGNWDNSSNETPYSGDSNLWPVALKPSISVVTSQVGTNFGS